MIIRNGTIEFKSKSGGGIDPVTGHPIKPTSSSWGDPIPCQYSSNKHNNLGRVSGEHFTIASYAVLIEEQPLEESEQIRLTDDAGNVVGEYSIIEVEPLEAVCEIRIWI